MSFEPEAWRRELVGFLERLGAGRAAEDLVQETFLRACSTPPRGPVRAWLYRVALNLWRDHGRSRVRESRALEARSRREESPGAPSAAHRAALREDAARAWATVRELPERQRLALWLRLRRHMDYDEIAIVLDCRVATARQHFHLAIRRVREALGDPES